MKTNVHILIAHCHAQGVELVTNQGRRNLPFNFHETAFTPEIRRANPRRRETRPLTTAVLPATFKLKR